MPPTSSRTVDDVVKSGPLGSTTKDSLDTTKRPYNSDVSDPLKQRKMRLEENEFIWANFSEPHAERRKRILAVHGAEIKKLMNKIEWKTKWIAFAVVLTQMTFTYTLPQYFLKDFLGAHGWLPGGSHFCPGLIDRGAEWLFGTPFPNPTPEQAAVQDLSFAAAAEAAPFYTTWLPLLAFSWLIGGALTQNMFLAIHEISHNTAFKTPIFNDFLCMWCNFVVAFPFAMMFKSYHQEHHRYLGWEGVDTDLPEAIEAWFLRSFPGKVFFLFFQTLFYALRPMISRAPKIRGIHITAWVVMIGWWLFQYYVFGLTRFAISWLNCLFSSMSTSMFHPTSGHFISEHYVFNPDTFQETFSYYGLGNLIGWNVGYHNEHHDFPSIPWSLLPEVRRIAPEFYEPLETTGSWTWTLVDFLKNSGVSEYSRVKRERGAGRRTGSLLPTTTEANATPAADPAAMRAYLDALEKKYPFDSNNRTIIDDKKEK